MRVFRIALAVIAVHVVDDSFVQPQPGTSPGDHLVSGLAVLAALALAAWAYPRLRGGRRGALALLFGLFGLIAGAEALQSIGAMAGDDYTGLLAIPAGLALLGLGTATLWSTRRTHGNRPWRYVRRSLLGATGVLVDTPRRRPAQRRIPLHPPRARGRRSGQPRRRLRARVIGDQRRPRVGRVVRAVAQRRRGHRLPRPQRPAGPHAHARPPRLRRAAVRPPRAGRERRRPARLRLGGREGHQGRDRVPAAPARRRPRTDRRSRAVRRRRTDAPGRGRDRRAQGRRLRRRRLALGGRVPRDA